MLKSMRGLLPQIVLLSDSAVKDERSVCRFLQEALREWGPNAPRIFTCGIGEGGGRRCCALQGSDLRSTLCDT